MSLPGRRPFPVTLSAGRVHGTSGRSRKSSLSLAGGGYLCRCRPRSCGPAEWTGRGGVGQSGCKLEARSPEAAAVRPGGGHSFLHCGRGARAPSGALSKSVLLPEGEPSCAYPGVLPAFSERRASLFFHPAAQVTAAMAFPHRPDAPELPDFSMLKRLARDQLIYLLEQVSACHAGGLYCISSQHSLDA